MSNNLNPNQALFTAARLGVQARMGIGRTEQPQSQSRPQAGASTLMNSRSAAHQSHQLYPIPSNAQVQSQVQFRQSHPSQPTGSSTPQDTRPNDNPNTILNQFLNQLHDQQRHFTESLAKRDKYLEALISSVCSIRETAAGLTKKSEAHDGILEKLERNSRGDDKVTNAKMVEVMKVLVGEMKGFKKTLGKSCDGDDGRTVLGRLDAVTFAVGELLERARDPEANLSEPSAPTTISPVIDLTMSRSPSPPPVRRTSPVQSRTYADVGTSPVPSSPPFKEKSFASIQGKCSNFSRFLSIDAGRLF
ncbi:hypothetical protein BYT27DRAFT_7205675 [Phlegmacium glaucopus]|nr:hypothetical protein BYT27DRAFT_7205675 [Phlegmacium glaucopus]